MNHVNLDAWTRRASLLPLGTSVLTTLAPSITVDAKKKRKKKRNKGDANKLCKKQVGQCLDFLNTNCQDAECLEAAELCCPVSGDCQFAAFVFCLNAASQARPGIGLPVTE